MKFYNGSKVYSAVKTYADMIALLEVNLETPVFMPVFYGKGSMEWFKIDNVNYLKCLKYISKPDENAFPCRVEIEHDGEIFFHPKETP